MKLLKRVIVLCLIPYPVAIFSAFAFASFTTSLISGKISEWPFSALQEAEVPPGYLICSLIILAVQFFLGALPIFFLRLFKSGLVGFLITGLTVASLSVAVIMGGETSNEFHLFVSTLFCLIVGGYFLSYRLLAGSVKGSNISPN